MKIIFKARFRSGPTHIVGEYEMSEEEWEEELEDSTGVEDWLQNRGADWAYDAVHSDNLVCWAEIKE